MQLVGQRNESFVERSLGGDFEIGVGIDSSELCAFDERVEERSDLGAPMGFGTVVIFPPDDHASKHALDVVVVEVDVRVFQKDLESRPWRAHVANGFSERTLR